MPRKSFWEKILLRPSFFKATDFEVETRWNFTSCSKGLKESNLTPAFSLQHFMTEIFEFTVNNTKHFSNKLFLNFCVGSTYVTYNCIEKKMPFHRLCNDRVSLQCALAYGLSGLICDWNLWSIQSTQKNASEHASVHDSSSRIDGLLHNCIRHTGNVWNFLEQALASILGMKVRKSI